jgi:hypothetical protein
MQNIQRAKDILTVAHRRTSSVLYSSRWSGERSSTKMMSTQQKHPEASIDCIHEENASKITFPVRGLKM